MTRLEKLRKLADATPDDPFIHYGVGLEYVNLEKWPEALECFRIALRLDTNYIAAYYQKSRAELRLGQRDAAKDTLTKGIVAAKLQNQKHAADEMLKTLESLG
jgi:tetratricopeptide (TPR) repeat protein